MKTNFLLRLRRSLIKKLTQSMGYPNTHIINHLFDGVRIDPVYLERPLQYSIYFNDNYLLTRSLYDFKKKYLNSENVFIIGSGPSIKTQPISNLRNEKTILLNGAIHLIRSHNLKPIGVVIIDDSFIRKNINTLSFLSSSTPLFLSFYALKEIIRCVPNLINNPIYLIHELKCAGDNIPAEVDQKLQQFDKPTWGVFDSGTVMAPAIQLAAFIRAQNVWLLGLDISNSKNEPRFYETHSNICRSSLLDDYDHKILPFMKLTSAWYKRHNLKIFNCSPITKIPFDIIPFKDLSDFKTKS